MSGEKHTKLEEAYPKSTIFFGKTTMEDLFNQALIEKWEHDGKPQLYVGLPFDASHTQGQHAGWLVAGNGQVKSRVTFYKNIGIQLPHGHNHQNIYRTRDLKDRTSHIQLGSPCRNPGNQSRDRLKRANVQDNDQQQAAVAAAAEAVTGNVPNHGTVESVKRQLTEAQRNVIQWKSRENCLAQKFAYGTEREKVIRAKYADKRRKLEQEEKKELRELWAAKV